MRRKVHNYSKVASNLPRGKLEKERKTHLRLKLYAKKGKRYTVLGTDNFLLKKADMLWKEEKHNCIAPIKENQEERYDEALQKQLWTIWDLDLQGIVAMKRCENAAGPVEQKMGFTAFQFLQTDVFFLPPKKLVSGKCLQLYI